METTKIDGDVSASVTVDRQIARIIEQAQEQGLQLTGEGGLLPDMIRQAVEAALHAESCTLRCPATWDTSGTRRRAGGRGTPATG